jgi:hypothetical protein
MRGASVPGWSLFILCRLSFLGGGAKGKEEVWRGIVQVRGDFLVMM